MTTGLEDVTRHCERCRCGDSGDCIESLCKCDECSCEVEAEDVSKMTSMALRFLEIKYGGPNRG